MKIDSKYTIRCVSFLISQFLFLFSLDNILYSQENDTFNVSLSPGLQIPLFESADLFNTGTELDIGFSYRLPFLAKGSVLGDVSYGLIPIRTEDAVSVLSVGSGFDYSWIRNERGRIGTYAVGGYHYGQLTDGSNQAGGNIYIKSGIGIVYNMFPSVSLGMNFFYRKDFSLYDGIGLSFGAVYRLTRQRYLRQLTATSPGPQPLKLQSIELKSLFPVLYGYYDSHPVGIILIKNSGSEPIKDASIYLYAEHFMDNPKLSAEIEELKPEEEKEIKLFALLNDDVMTVTEGTKVSAKISCRYTYQQRSVRTEFSDALYLHNRNAVTWDDDRKVAAFVTAKDPIVLELAKNVTSWINQQNILAVNDNLSIAFAFHQALRQQSISYVVDPTTPFKDFSEDVMSVDYIQFPRQTFQYSSGDCDDLSILYCSMFEAVGIETAFITVPGHIFFAFSLDMTADQVKQTFSNPEDFIFFRGKTWVPFESTALKYPFEEAWNKGAREWREYSETGQARFYPVHDSWQLYAPVAMPGEGNIDLPEKDILLASYYKQVNEFIDGQIDSRVTVLEERIRRRGKSAPLYNSLGVLHARYGLKRQAEQYLQQALGEEEYLPALINMGNLKFLDNDMENALLYYERAAKLEPDNRMVLLGLARINHRIENYRLAKSFFNSLKQHDPELATKFSYLEMKSQSSARASDVESLNSFVVWEEE